MKIAIVHDFLTKLGGAEKVLQVLHRMYPDAPIYTLLYDEKGTKNTFSQNDYKIITSSLQSKPNFIKKRSKILLPYFASAVEEFDLADFDVVISSSNSYAHGVITRPGCLHLCYCYSPTRYVWDWHHQYLKENGFNRGYLGRKVCQILSKIRIWDFLAASRVDYWVAISDTVASRIKKYYRTDPITIYPPTNLEKITLANEEPEDYYLIVSRLSPYKKIDLAIRAFNKSNLKLFIVGEGSDRQRLEKLAHNNISFLGYQSDEKVISLMRKCRAFIFPGEEDFGLTPIESMACGRPVIAYKKGGVTETVLDGKTGMFFEEDNVDSLVSTLKIFNERYNIFSPAECRKQAEKFSEEVFIDKFKKTVINAYSLYNLKNK